MNNNRDKICDAWIFARIDDFLVKYQPLTPWGKDWKSACTIETDLSKLESSWNDIELYIKFHNSKELSIHDKISYHLKRICRIPINNICEENFKKLDQLELFQVKKFLSNYRGLFSCLTEYASLFGIEQIEKDSDIFRLAYELDRGGSDPESFYISDSYSKDLANVRKEIAEIDKIILNEKIIAESKAKLDFGLFFEKREFLVIDKAIAAKLSELPGAFSLEPYDNKRYIVRMLPSANALEAMSRRTKLIDDEHREEEKVIKTLQVLVFKAKSFLEEAVISVTRFDKARSAALLAMSYNMTRPIINNSNSENKMILENAVFIPCAEDCNDIGLSYTALNAIFNKKAVVLFGSNMGGKTIALKTILFFQIVSQLGLFVPAQRFESVLYGNVNYVGELTGERLTGLSGFGFELWRLENALRNDTESSLPALTAFDELARTTGSSEAAALLSAVAEYYSKNKNNSMAFFATHFRGVERLPLVLYCRMKGLDRKKAAELLSDSNSTLKDTSLENKLGDINRSMKYEIISDDENIEDSDALVIASLLGLDSAITSKASYYLNKKLRQNANSILH